MDRKRNFLQAIALGCTLCLAATAPAWGADAPLARAPIATMSLSASGIDWQPQMDHGGVVLTVSGPDGFYLRQEFAPDASPSFDIFDKAGNLLPDGAYKFELTLSPRLGNEAKRAMAATGDAQRGLEGQTARGLVESGFFRVHQGAIVLPEGEEERSAKGVAAVLSGATAKDQVILDDLIVDGSICVGLDCVNGESFGFDTLRLKENNLRIKFQDTSNSASFPTNDWQLTINDSSNGGANKFSIDDIDGGRTPFTIEAGAPTNSLYVEDSGELGLGTANPVVEVHVVDGDTPTVRLEQDGSSGFTPQTWDVAGNETNFFIRDVTNGSTLPFRIRPGAPTSAIDIAASGNVGVGTTSPGAGLHINRTTGGFANILQLSNNSGVGFILDNTTGNDVFISVNNAATAYTVNFDDGDGAEFSLDAGGNITGVTSCVDCSAPSDRNLKENFASVDRAAILEALLGLDIQTWNYKEFSPDLRHIGPVSQDFYALFNVGRDVTLNPVDTFGVAVAAIQALNGQVSELSKLVAEQRALIEELRQAIK